MLIKNQDLDIPEDDPWKNDCLGRKPFAEKLISLISTLKQPFVISLHSPWGTGKTEFIRMFNQEIQNRGFASFYFNAWENDLSDEPLFNFIGEVASNSSTILRSAGHRATKEELCGKIKGFAKALAGPAVRILTRNALEIEEMKAIWNIGRDDAKDISKFLGDVAQKKLEGHNDKKKALCEFREKLTDFRNTLDQYYIPRPTVFFIDELDRCRPDYAIKLLESIKHLFNVDGYLFILSVDKTQLESIVHSTLGACTEASPYLRKFIDLEIQLPTPQAENFFDYLSERTNLNILLPEINTTFYSHFKHCFVSSAKHFKLSLREQCHLVTQLIILFSSLKEEGCPPHSAFSPHVLCIKMKRNSIYSEIIQKTTTYADLGKKHFIFPEEHDENNAQTKYTSQLYILYKCHLMNDNDYNSFMNSTDDMRTTNKISECYLGTHLKKLMEAIDTFNTSF